MGKQWVGSDISCHSQIELALSIERLMSVTGLQDNMSERSSHLTHWVCECVHAILFANLEPDLAQACFDAYRHALDDAAREGGLVDWTSDEMWFSERFDASEMIRVGGDPILHARRAGMAHGRLLRTCINSMM
ncbi:hypothetical protein BamMC406_6620 (plasmid) [Burkholderia ambifaria MC40-6]|uniref:Uncharacterized protein n=1 Tax=Burkholderia ambifaria (strain MC40-6) TaxID=398577 RepID=B1Z6F9_BURA4|nr:hypothetical protein [Burkholderia ambifaria]ACB69036.1 hypothetical protein BamMC406_6620 [Burkholderia ambifaria MC40-6]